MHRQQSTNVAACMTVSFDPERGIRASLEAVRKEAARVAREHDVRPFDGTMSDREWELAAREEQFKFDKYRREKKL